VHQIVREFEAAHLKQSEFDFRPGDTVRVSVRIVEGGKERIQDFEGVCIRRQGGGMGETFTVRRVSYSVGMERIFPLHSPRVEAVQVVRRGKVRRANLSYLRGLSGKKARITEDLLRSRKIAGKKAERLRALADMQGGPVATPQAEPASSGESQA
jgi:large subunit ribosomal protein L19